jgi:hypothetical protein
MMAIKSGKNMKTQDAFATTTCPNTLASRLRTVCAARLLPLLLLFTLPAVVQAQFTYTTNDGTITITGYTGSGGAVTIPDTITGLPVTSIASYAFDYCYSLTIVTIGTNVTSIGIAPFYSCASLSAIMVDTLNMFYSSVDGVLFDKSTNTLIQYPGGKTGGYTVPNSVTSIGVVAFASSTNLTSVTIPNSVTNIGSYAFSPCTSLSAITVDTLNSFYSSVDGVLFNKSTNTLIQCPGGKTGGYTVPNSVTSIESYAFYSCRNLASVTIPDSVTSIGSYAFYSCTNLTSITIPNSVTSVGPNVFKNCTSLTNATIGNSVTNIGSDAFYSCTKLTSITIPDSVTSIGSNAFYSCTSLTNATIGNSVTSIGSYAFYSCRTLASVTIPNGVTGMGSYTFYSCTSLTNATIGNSVTSIGSYAFYSCTSLTNITIGNSVTNIGSYAFSRCTSLTSVTIPNSVTSIGSDAFYFCTKLTSVTIPNSVTNIGGEAFYLCGSLTSVTIGNHVTSIGSFAFSECGGLPRVYFQGNAPSIGSYVFDGDFNATVYYLPGTTGWENFALLTGLPTVLWNPQVQTDDASFGVRTNRFGFNIAGSSNLVIVVEACTNLATPVWSPIGTNTLNTFIGTNGTSYFSDPDWTNYPGRYYRIRSP